ncbi:MAG: leucine-rich repeat domain-containing protein [Duncaniella sp.]|nr:leucine-rich repeat domain-containing protein [Duncaniella sp.]
MKKLQLRVFQAFMMVMLAVGSLALTSCNDDDDNAPETVTVDGINYILNSDNTCTVTTGNYIGAVNIPGAIEAGDRRFQVTKIGAKAFMSCTELTAVNIPNTVLRIDVHAFDGCANLTSVNLPSNLLHVGNYAFNGCALTEITIPDAVTVIGAYAFQGNPAKKITIGKSVNLINWCAFRECNLDEIVIYNPNAPKLDYYTELDAWPFNNYSLENAIVKIPVPLDAGQQAVYKSSNGWSIFDEIGHMQFGTSAQ